MARRRTSRSRWGGRGNFFGLGTNGIVNLGLAGAIGAAIFARPASNFLRQRGVNLSSDALAFSLGGPLGGLGNVALGLLTQGGDGGAQGAAW